MKNYIIIINGVDSLLCTSINQVKDFITTLKSYGANVAIKTA